MITVDYRDRRPLFEQIIENVEHLAAQGLLSPGEQIPSVRQLARDLSINPNTIQRAYSELERRGVIAEDFTPILEKKEQMIADDLMDISKKAIALKMDRENFLGLCGRCYDGAREEMHK